MEGPSPNTTPFPVNKHTVDVPRPSIIAPAMQHADKSARYHVFCRYAVGGFTWPSTNRKLFFFKKKKECRAKLHTETQLSGELRGLHSFITCY